MAWNNAKARKTYALDALTMNDQNLTRSLFREPGGKLQNAAMSVRSRHLYLSLPAQTAAVFTLAGQ